MRQIKQVCWARIRGRERERSPSDGAGMSEEVNQTNQRYQSSRMNNNNRIYERFSAHQTNMTKRYYQGLGYYGGSRG